MVVLWLKKIANSGSIICRKKFRPTIRASLDQLWPKMCGFRLTAGTYNPSDITLFDLIQLVLRAYWIEKVAPTVTKLMLFETDP